VPLERGDGSPGGGRGFRAMSQAVGDRQEHPARDRFDQVHVPALRFSGKGPHRHAPFDHARRAGRGITHSGAAISSW